MSISKESEEEETSFSERQEERLFSHPSSSIPLLEGLEGLSTTNLESKSSVSALSTPLPLPDMCLSVTSFLSEEG